MRLDVMSTATTADFPQLDPGLAALLAAVLTSIVAIIGHRVSVSKNKTEQAATHVEGFQKLTSSLQSQIDTLQRNLDSLAAEVTGLKRTNISLSAENQALKSQIQTKDEVIGGFARWIELWEAWFERVSAVANVDPPPEYTWQMREYVKDLNEVARDAPTQRSMEEDWK